MRNIDYSPGYSGASFTLDGLPKRNGTRIFLRL
jgi:hypothetical protein